jgi:hypothetical protein
MRVLHNAHILSLNFRKRQSTLPGPDLAPRFYLFEDELGGPKAYDFQLREDPPAAAYDSINKVAYRLVSTPLGERSSLAVGQFEKSSH